MASRISAIIKKIGSSEDKLLEVLIEVQKSSEKKYISEEDMWLIERETGISFNKIKDVATFYTLISTKPRGRYVVQLCKSTPCFVQGALNIEETLKSELKLAVGETSEAHSITVEHTECIGACDMAPAIKINQTTYGHLGTEKLMVLIEKMKEGVL